MKPRERKTFTHITQGVLGSVIWKMSLPMMGAALLQDLFSLVDLFFVGRLGHIAVAALSISGAVVSVLIMFGIGIATGTTALVGHFVGKKDYKSADNVIFQAIVFSAICSVLMVFVGLFLAEPLLRLFGASGEIIAPAVDYLRITFVGSIFIFLYVSLSQGLSGAGDVKTPVKILVVSNVLNMILDPLFIFGIGPFPAMGVAGSAFATVATRMVGLGILFYHMAFSKSSAIHLYRGIYKVNFRVMGRMIHIGIFASLQALLRNISFLLLMRLVTSFGPIALAAYGIGQRLRMAIMVPGMGMANATGIVMAQNLGSGQPDRAHKAGWAAVRLYEFIAIPAGIAFLLFAPQLIGIFSGNFEVIKEGASFLRWTALTFPFLAFAMVLSNGINGVGDTFAPAVMTACFQLGMRIPLCYVLAHGAGFGPAGIWIGFNLPIVLQAVVMVWYFRRGLWEKRYLRHRHILEEGPVYSGI